MSNDAGPEPGFQGNNEAIYCFAFLVTGTQKEPNSYTPL